MRALVSLSDHDCIGAPLLLRVVPAMHETPVSLEWTVPFQTSKFHLGVHNLPARACPGVDRRTEGLHRAAQHRARLRPAAHAARDSRSTHRLQSSAVESLRQSAAEFAQNVEDFLALNNGRLHAFELNGLRRWEENRRVAQLAARWQQILISGGDRHGCEPNANLNLTNATSFAEWVHELRVERRSQLLFMPQYDHSFAARCYQTFLDAVREYPDHSDGARRWDQRTYHPGRDGSMQPISSLWKRIPGFSSGNSQFCPPGGNHPPIEHTSHLRRTANRQMPDISGQEEGA